MSQSSNPKLCAAVRDALLSGSFETISRAEVDAHLRQHRACAEWAAFLVSVTHALAAEQPVQAPGADFSDGDLLTYWEGGLSPKQRHEIEDAACRDQKIFRRLYSMRQSRLKDRLKALSASVAASLLERLSGTECSALSAPLEKSKRLHFSQAQAAAEASLQLSTFQTPDGRLVLSVVSEAAASTSAQAPESRKHRLDINIRVQEPSWMGRWACYRVTNARNELAAIGFVKFDDECGTLVREEVPATAHSPYTVHVHVLEVDDGTLEEALAELRPELSDEPDS